MAPGETSRTSGDDGTQVQPPDPEVVPQARPRQFSAEYKLRILAEGGNGCAMGHQGSATHGPCFPPIAP